jgi:muramoyltetrapeptide carboxypeptidase
MAILPQKLNKGDTIGIISPAGAIKEVFQLEAAIKYFEDRGYKIKLAPHAGDRNAYLAGKDQDRLSDLMDFFTDTEIKAIICSRGGYGSFRLLEKINWGIIRNNPKIFVGYSDITALLNNFVEKSSLVCFHGPLAISDFGAEKINPYTEKVFWEILEGAGLYEYENPVSYQCITRGQAEGVLMGGNLSILCGLLGTSYFPDLAGKIILIEDVGEPLYKIDRMLMQLKLAGVFKRAAGFIFSEFTSIPDTNYNLSPVDIIKEHICGLNIPVGYGFAASHSEQKATLPLGTRYRFDSRDFRLEILEEYLKQI